MRRLTPFVAWLFLALALVGRAAPARTTAEPLTRDEFVAAVAGNLSAHFNLEGELQLELLRAWAAPSRLARDWTVELTEYPSVIASSMLARCRVLADGQ